MMHLPHLATRVFDTPLLIAPQKLETILGVLAPRFGLELPGAAAAVAAERAPRKPYEVTPDGIAVIPNRQGNLKFVARFENGSTEYAKLKAQATGTAVITLAYDANNSLELTWQKVAFQTVEVAETDQILTVAVECTPMYDSGNGVLTAVAKCSVDGICQ